jgi:predicted neuraminidase
MRSYVVTLLLVLPPVPARACQYTPHPNTTFLGGTHDNVISCEDTEGLAHCRARCDADDQCSGFGIYTTGSRVGRCCTKSDNLGPAAWSSGTSYLKQSDTPGCAVMPEPPSAPVSVSVIFRGNASYAYNKGAMIELLPDGRIAAACQAGAKEGSTDQRILYSISDAYGRFDATGGWVQTAPETQGLSQWEPTLFLAPNRTLWLFFSQGVAPLSGSFNLFSQTAEADTGYTRWSSPRLLFNTSTARPARNLMWPVNRVITTPGQQDWLLPCDWGCAPPTGAFAMRSSDAGISWKADSAIPGTALQHGCPEPALAVVNSSTLLAIVRNTGTGFLQSWSHDNGQSWSAAVPSSVPGASSKMALQSLPTTSGASSSTLVLAWSVRSRERMALSTSTDGGVSWRYYATLDNGTSVAPPESSDCYPTVLHVRDSLLTTWSTYDGGPRVSVDDETGYANIKLARTPLPDVVHA